MREGRRLLSGRLLRLIHRSPSLGIFRFKFTMNFLMNLSTQFQIIAALLVGGWLVHTEQLEIGGVVAVISGIGRFTDPWGNHPTGPDLVPCGAAERRSCPARLRAGQPVHLAHRPGADRGKVP